MLYELYKYNERVTNAYNDFAFNRGIIQIHDYSYNMYLI